MIKIALKHWIYEKCINAFFEKVNKNFLLSHNPNDFRLGDRFEYITVVFITDGRTVLKMYNCTIVGIEERVVYIQYFAGEMFGNVISYHKSRCWETLINCIFDYRRK